MSEVNVEIRPAVLTASLALALASPVIFANDASFGGRGSDLIPLRETRVRMLSEDIRLELDPVQEAWRVTATYRFENPTSDRVRVQMGFPEELCPPDTDCSPYAGAFRDLVTTVRGQPVEQRTGAVQGAERWAEVLGKVWLYDVEFAPRETVAVVHSYRYDRSTGVDWWGTRYLTRTGALWSGTIGHARFTVKLPGAVWYALFPAVFQLVSFTEGPNAGGVGSHTELVFEAHDWRPEVDFQVYFPGPSIHGMSPEGYCAGFGQDLSTEEATTLVSAYDTSLLRACRNHLYALHGYVFQDPALRAVYEAAPDLPEWAASAGLKLATRPNNASFAPAWLSPGEATLLAAIVAEERRRGP